MSACRHNGRFVSGKKLKKEKNLLRIEKPQEWRNGRRIIEIGFLADEMFCKECNCRLHFQDIVNETKYGLASYLDFRCKQCSEITRVTTGKQHLKTTGRKILCFDVNTKMAAAMINAGVGESQITSILAELNIPPPTCTTMKRRECEVGVSIEEIAKQSCLKAVEQETKTNENESNTGTRVILDGGWQKRGSGRAHDSMSGHLVVVGSKSKRCLDFGVAKKKCRVCKTAEKLKATPRVHDCRKNYSGSSKAMESFLAVRSLQNLKETGVHVTEVVMDDDSTTMCKIKSQIDAEMVKCSDSNHVKKNFSNELYRLQQSNKNLTKKNIAYLKRSFSYAIVQNKDSEEGIRTNLKAIIPHVYGDHELCVDTKWCSHFKGLEEDASQNVRRFNDSQLRESLELMFSKYLTDEWITKLATLDSSNSIENMNHLVARKAPKSLHLSESASLDFRVSAAILQNKRPMRA